MPGEKSRDENAGDEYSGSENSGMKVTEMKIPERNFGNGISVDEFSDTKIPLKNVPWTECLGRKFGGPNVGKKVP